MAIAIRSTITLDPTWVDSILITAFDGNYGACWYWIREDFPDSRRIYDYDAGGPESGLLLSVTLSNIDPELINDFRYEVADRKARTAKLDLEAVQWACNQVLGNDHYQGIETSRQLHRAVEYAMSYPEEAPDLDAEAADVLVQLALFGQIVYG